MRKHLLWIMISAVVIAVTLWVISHIFSINKEATDSINDREQTKSVLSAAAAENNGTPEGLTATEKQTEPDYLGYKSEYGDLPEALRGAEVPGDLQTDRDGYLIVNRGIRDMFEYFWSGINQESPDIVLGRTREYIRHKINSNAAMQANKILDDYVKYKDFLAKNNNYNINDPAMITDKKAFVSSIRDAMNFRIEARHKMLGAEVAEAFFATDEAYDRYSLKKLEVNVDPHLSQQEKEAKFRALDEEYKN